MFKLSESALALDWAAAHDASIFFDEDIYNSCHFGEIVGDRDLNRVGIASFDGLHLEDLVVALDGYLEDVFLLERVCKQDEHTVLTLQTTLSSLGNLILETYLSNFLWRHRKVRLFLSTGSLLLPYS